MLPKSEPIVAVGLAEGLQEARVRFAGPFNGPQGIISGEKILSLPIGGALYSPMAEVSTFAIGQIVIGKGFHWQRCEEQRFRGSLRMLRDGESMVVINDIGLEDYLKSVISSEMSATCSQGLLRAHAVLSRSWLLAMLGREKRRKPRAQSQKTNGASEILRWWDRDDHMLFDVCADDHCQRYQGVNRLSDEAIKAVEATRGIVLTYGGEVCDARFSKCCGGRTELFGNCWEDREVPYLESVKCPFCAQASPSVLGKILNGYDREDTNFINWTAVYAPGELESNVSDNIGRDLGQILALEPVETGPSGRMVRLCIHGSAGNVIIGKELMIRKALKSDCLRSSNFEASRGADGSWRLKGRGWGHGVGLCQIGAAVMGEKGCGYEEILRHYFPKASIQRIY